jgi:hypothetical protein
MKTRNGCTVVEIIQGKYAICNMLIKKNKTKIFLNRQSVFTLALGINTIEIGFQFDLQHNQKRNSYIANEA